VVGTVPPPGGERARALGQIAAGLVAAGDTVEIVSPDPRSAAHVTGALSGLGLVRRLTQASRRFDGLVLRLEPDLPFRGDESRLVRAGLLFGLGLAVRRFERVTLYLDSPIPIPHGVGGRASRDLWARAHVVVQTDQDRDAILAVPSVEAARIELVPPVQPTDRDRSPEWPGPDAPSLRSRVLEVVRARAEATRAIEQAGVGLQRATEPASRPVPISAFDAAPSTTRVSAPALVRLVARKAAGHLRRSLQKAP